MKGSEKRCPRTCFSPFLGFQKSFGYFPDVSIYVSSFLEEAACRCSTQPGEDLRAESKALPRAERSRSPGPFVGFRRWGFLGSLLFSILWFGVWGLGFHFSICFAFFVRYLTFSIENFGWLL